jgi:tetratricopeptide (TPR) repeat protein
MRTVVRLLSPDVLAALLLLSGCVENRTSQIQPVVQGLALSPKVRVQYYYLIYQDQSLTRTHPLNQETQALGYQKTAIEALYKGIELSPAPYFYTAWGILILAAFKCYNEVLEAATEGVRRYLGLVQFYIPESGILALSKSLDKAREIMEQGLPCVSGDANRYYYGMLLRDMGDETRALAAMEQAILKNPKHAEALNYLSYTLADENHELDRALVLVQSALRQALKNCFMIDSLVWVYFRMGRLDYAWSQIRQALSLAPNDSEFWNHYGDIAKALGKTGKVPPGLHPGHQEEAEGPRAHTGKAARPMRRSVALFCVALLAALLTQAGCTPKRILDSGTDPAALTWQKFRSRHLDVKPPPALLLRGSFTYTSPNLRSKTNRMVMYFFGDLNGPLRLDVQSVVGTSLSCIRESWEELLAFYPDRRTAYRHRNPVIGAQRLGLPFPFSLACLAQLVCGDFGALVSTMHDKVRPVNSMGFEYRFKKGRVTSLVLDYMGNPVSMTGPLTRPSREGETWTISFSGYSAEAPDLCSMLTLDLPEEENGVLRIKSRELKLEPWPAESLKLALPDGTEVRRLDLEEVPPVLEMDGSEGFLSWVRGQELRPAVCVL